MKNDFARIITMLRKERKLSQKQAAEEIGISQALLSHYENGVRHCSVELLCKIADYYNVSCDYLTGKSTEKNGQVIDFESIPDNSAGKSKPISANSIIPVVNKKILVNSINILYSMLEDLSNKTLTNEISSYLDLAVYKMFREIYSLNRENVSCFFSVSKQDSGYLGDAALKKTERNISHLCKEISDNNYGETDRVSIPQITYDEIDKKYPQYRSSLMTLIKNTEEKISKEI